jgi:hypothetical protein
MPPRLQPYAAPCRSFASPPSLACASTRPPAATAGAGASCARTLHLAPRLLPLPRLPQPPHSRPSHPTAAPATPMPRQPRPSRAAAALSRLTLALTRAYSCVRAPAAQDAATPPYAATPPLRCYTPLTLLHPPYAATPAYAATPPYAAQDAPWYDCATGRLLPKPLVERAYTTVAAAKALIDVTPVAKLRQVLLMRPSRTRNPNPNPGPTPNPNPNPSQYQPEP